MKHILICYFFLIPLFLFWLWLVTIVIYFDTYNELFLLLKRVSGKINEKPVNLLSHYFFSCLFFFNCMFVSLQDQEKSNTLHFDLHPFCGRFIFILVHFFILTFKAKRMTSYTSFSKLQV